MPPKTEKPTETVNLRARKRIIGADRANLRERLKERYEHGMSIRALAEEEGRSYGNIHKLLLEAGVELRRRGGDVRKGGLSREQQREYAERLASAAPAKRRR